MSERNYEFIENGESKFESIINDEDNYFPTTKTNYIVHAFRPAIGTKVYNFIEDEHYVTDEKNSIVLIGTKGEMWPVKESKLLSDYKTTPELVSNIGEEPISIETKGGQTIQWAMKIPEDISFIVQTPWGAELLGNKEKVINPNTNEEIGHDGGDYIVCEDLNGRPNLEDRRFVNGVIFERTYSKKFENTVETFEADDFKRAIDNGFGIG